MAKGTNIKWSECMYPESETHGWTDRYASLNSNLYIRIRWLIKTFIKNSNSNNMVRMSNGRNCRNSCVKILCMC